MSETKASKNIQLIPVHEWQIKAAKAGSLSKLLLPMQEYTKTDLTGSELDAGSAVQDGDANWILCFPPHRNSQEAQQFTLKAYPKGCNEGIVIPFKCGDFIQLQERAWDNKLLAPMQDEFVITNVQVKQIKDLRFGYSDSAFQTIQEASRYWELSNPDYSWFSFRWLIELDIAQNKL